MAYRRADRDPAADEERARRKAATEMAFEYHQEQLRILQEHVREGFGRFDRGEIDSFELDHVIFHYSRSAKELWKFCGNGESRISWAVAAIESRRHSGSEPDWWEIGDPDRRRTIPWSGVGMMAEEGGNLVVGEAGPRTERAARCAGQGER